MDGVLDLISPIEYNNIVNEIETRLGWRQSSLNREDTLEHIEKRLEGLKRFDDFPKEGEKEKYEDFFRARLTYVYIHNAVFQ